MHTLHFTSLVGHKRNEYAVLLLLLLSATLKTVQRKKKEECNDPLNKTTCVDAKLQISAILISLNLNLSFLIYTFFFPSLNRNRDSKGIRIHVRTKLLTHSQDKHVYFYACFTCPSTLKRVSNQLCFLVIVKRSPENNLPMMVPDYNAQVICRRIKST